MSNTGSLYLKFWYFIHYRFLHWNLFFSYILRLLILFAKGLGAPLTLASEVSASLLTLVLDSPNTILNYCHGASPCPRRSPWAFWTLWSCSCCPPSWRVLPIILVPTLASKLPAEVHLHWEAIPDLPQLWATLPYTDSPWHLIYASLRSLVLVTRTLNSYVTY